jgi:lysyl-tRNA synthetase class 2
VTDVGESDQVAQRKAKLAAARERGNPYPNDFRRSALARELLERYGDEEQERLEGQAIAVAVAGRVMSRRIMGKASFAHLQDMSDRIQIYLRRDDLPEGVYNDFKTWDLGDIVGVEGTLFKTRSGELSVKANAIRLLTKALRPLPEKFHGLADRETRYRQRYLDLLVNEQTRATFRLRAAVIDCLRRFFSERGFLEVETPMMQPLPGGATARPFVTHHNALDMDLYLRVAPELFLKRLVVAGLEKVYEINRNFRNEGLSTQHNPEFTMVEFYQAYSDFMDLMDLTEELMREVAREVLGHTRLTYAGICIDFAQPFRRMTLKESILHFNGGIAPAELDECEAARAVAKRLQVSVQNSDGLGKIQLELFEKTVESQLMEPTFIVGYPTDVSPLARRNDDDPFLADRFEFFVGGREIANGFSELNDPYDQAERFREQALAKEDGNLEAMPYDEDYIRALEHGLPPTAGEGIGIDRLVMLLTDQPSIRDVILFPHLRPADSAER